MKKYIALFTILILCFVLFTGCTASGNNDLNDRFLIAERGGNWIIYVDKNTNVMYLYTNCAYQGGISVMFDANGKPLLYEGEYDKL